MEKVISAFPTQYAAHDGALGAAYSGVLLAPEFEAFPGDAVLVLELLVAGGGVLY